MSDLAEEKNLQHIIPIGEYIATVSEVMSGAGVLRGTPYIKIKYILEDGRYIFGFLALVHEWEMRLHNAFGISLLLLFSCSNAEDVARTMRRWTSGFKVKIKVVHKKYEGLTIADPIVLQTIKENDDEQLP